MFCLSTVVLRPDLIVFCMLRSLLCNGNNVPYQLCHFTDEDQSRIYSFGLLQGQAPAALELSQI
jgi:hypothetical protein